MKAVGIVLGLFAGCLAGTLVGDERPFFQKLVYREDLLGDAQAARPVVCLPETAKAPPPTLDGRLEDPIWKEAVRLDAFLNLRTGRDPLRPVQAYVAALAEGLAVAFEAEAGVPADLASVRHALGTPQTTFRCLVQPRPESFGRMEFLVSTGGDEGLKGTPGTRVTHLKDFLWPAWKPETEARAICVYDAANSRVRAEFVIPYATLGETPEPGALWSFALYHMFDEMHRIPHSDQYQKESCGSLFGGFWGDSHAQVDRWPRLFFGTPEAFAQRTIPPVARLVTDRVEYRSFDENGEAYLELFGASSPVHSFDLDLRVETEKGEIVARHDAAKPRTGAIEIQIDPAPLKPGRYQLIAEVCQGGQAVARASCAFTRENQSRMTPVPRTYEQAGVPLALFSDTRLGTCTLPVSLGVPMPRGLLRDTARLVVEQDVGNQSDPGDWRPVPAQFDVRDRWYREGSIRWVGVSFDAEYRQGFPARYRMRWTGETTAPEPDRPLRVEESDADLIVTTGPARFRLSKTAFRLVDAAWLDRDGDGRFVDDEQLVRAAESDGLVYENGDQTVFTTAHARNRFRLLEVGPKRAVVAVDGWYEDAKGNPECRHTTRLFFSQGSQTVKIRHTWINTVDTGKGHPRVRDIHLSVGVPGSARYAFGGESGAIASGAIPRSGIYQIQLRSREAPIETGIGQPAGPDMGRMAGWLFAGTARGAVSLAGRDFWKLYPKELRVTRNGAVVHLWPIHGRPVFSESEQTPLGQIPKLLSAHHGRELDWTFPAYSFDKMGAYWQEAWARDPRGFGPFAFWKATRGRDANAQGVATSVEVDLTLHAPADTAAAARRQGEIVAVSPHGVADPEWTKLTEAVGPLHPYDPMRFGAVERLHREVFARTYIHQTEWLDDYGMWNWPDAHNYAYDAWAPSARTLHRFWRNSEYQPNRMAYLRYLRSGDPLYWRWATAKFRHGTDVDAVNYGEDRPVAPYHQRGSTYHCKGTLHWGGNGGVTAHFVTYDWMLLDYFLSGDPRGRDFVAMWAPETVRDCWVGEPERETCVPASELAYAYQHFRDARLLKPITHARDAAMQAPIEDFLAVPWMSQMFWYRMHAYCGDPRVRERMIAHWGDGTVKKRNNLGYGLEQYLFYRFTGDPRTLMLFSGVSPSFFRPRYTIEHPIAYELGTWPFLQSALAEVGATGDILMPNAGKSWERFWSEEIARAKAAGKPIWGRTFP